MEGVGRYIGPSDAYRCLGGYNVCFDVEYYSNITSSGKQNILHIIPNGSSHAHNPVSMPLTKFIQTIQPHGEV